MARALDLTLGREEAFPPCSIPSIGRLPGNRMALGQGVWRDLVGDQASAVDANGSFRGAGGRRYISSWGTRWPRRAPWSPRLTWKRYASTAPKRSDQAETKADAVSASATPSTTLSTLLPRLQTVQHENIYTVPNILTFTRLLAAPAVGYFIVHAQPWWALSLFFYAGVTDLADGYLARKYNAQTVVGTVIDPMADKFLMTIAVVALTMTHTLPLWLAVIILGRDLGLAISAIYFRWISLPPPKTMARYWDFSLPSAEVHPTEISKINTLLQLLLVGNALLLPVLPDAWVQAYNLVGVFEGWMYLVAGTTIWSGLSYVGSKDAVKILTRDEIDRRQQGSPPKQ